MSDSTTHESATPAAFQASVFGRGAWDRLGALLSGLCLVHCLLLPMALLVLPGFTLLGVVHETAHLVLALLLLPVTVAALRHPLHGGTHTPRAVSGALLIAGAALVWLALPLHEWVSETAATAATIAGSIALVAGHASRLIHRHHPSH